MSFIKYLLVTYHMPSTVLGAGDNVKELNKRPKSLLCDAYICLNPTGGGAHQGNREQMVVCTSEHRAGETGSAQDTGGKRLNKVV